MQELLTQDDFAFASVEQIEAAALDCKLELRRRDLQQYDKLRARANNRNLLHRGEAWPDLGRANPYIIKRGIEAVSKALHESLANEPAGAALGAAVREIGQVATVSSDPDGDALFDAGAVKIDRNLLVRLCIKANDMGLKVDVGENKPLRNARLQATNELLTGYCLKPVVSWNDLTIEGWNKVFAALDNGNLIWEE